MKSTLFAIICFSIAFLCINKQANAQYPDVPSSARKHAEKVKEIGHKWANQAWEAQQAKLKKQEREGKPYIPFARRPHDLPQADIPAFPGAQGGGMYSFGGRGGDVYVVTNLNDHGKGSLRWACSQVGARIVVFNVAGIIHLESPLIVKAPYVSIEGQSAPGDGVCVAGESFWINTHDVVIRYMRFRRGVKDVGRRDDALGGSPVGNIMIDHVSASWGLDENMSIYRHEYKKGPDYKEVKLPTVNSTIQNSISSEGLDTYNHAFGSTMGGENATFIRNLWADNTGRNPSDGWDGVFNFINNVLFNWYHRSVDGGDWRALYNMINNYYKPGPVTKDTPIRYRILRPDAGLSKNEYQQWGRVYAHGNIVEGNKKVTNNNWDGGIQLKGRDGKTMSLEEARKHFPYIKVDKPFPMKNPVRIMPAKRAFKYVLNHAGATLPHRDAVDKRVIEQVRTGKIDNHPSVDPDTLYQFKYRRLDKDSWKKGIITDVREVGGYPNYEGTPYKDSDHDGMPDAWEKAHGLDPNDPSDASKDLDGDGYTNIEEFLNGTDPQQYVDYTDPYNNYDVLSDIEENWFLND